MATKTAPFTIPSDGDGDGVSDTITVTGYHFDVSGIPVVSGSTGETTTVRVKQTFGGDPEYFHVETLEGDDGAYAHPLTKVEGQENIYACKNGVRINITSFDGTFSEEDVSMIRYDDTNTYAPIQQRAFGVSFSATFVQFSETPKA